MGKAGVANALAEALNGYVRGMQIRRGMDRDEKEDAYRDEQRERQRKIDAREDDERRQLAEAGQDVGVAEGAGGALKPDTMDNRDVGLPGEQGVIAGGFRVAGRDYADRGSAELAAAEANTSEAKDGRAAAAYRRIGKPAQAVQIEAAQTQQKTAKFTLDREQEKWVNEKFDQQLGSITDANQLAQVLTGSKAVGGATVTTVITGDGKKAQLMVAGPDGQQVKFGREFDNTPDGLQKMMVAHSKSMGIGAKATLMQTFAAFEEQKRATAAAEADRDATREQADTHFKAGHEQRDIHFNKKMEQDDRQFGVTSSISRANLGVAQAGLQLRREEHADTMKRKLPVEVERSVQVYDRTIQGIEKAITEAQARNEWDDKSEGAKALRIRLTKAYEARDALVKPYSATPGAAPAAGPAGGDYMGYGGKPGAASGAKPEPGSGLPTPRPQAAGGLPRPAAPPPTPATQAQPMGDPLLHAMGATGNNTVSAVVAQQAPVIRQAADQVRAAQAEVVAAANSKNPQAVAAAVQKAAQAGQQFQALLKDYNPAQAKAIAAAVGM